MIEKRKMAMHRSILLFLILVYCVALAITITPSHHALDEQSCCHGKLQVEEGCRATKNAPFYYKY